MVSVTQSLAGTAVELTLDDFLSQTQLGLKADELVLLRQIFEFAKLHYSERIGESGERTFIHAQGIALILSGLGTDVQTRGAGLLFAMAHVLPNYVEAITKAFGSDIAQMVANITQLLKLKELSRVQHQESAQKSFQSQTETLRKMLLAMASDVRVILLRLASRLQTLRFFAVGVPTESIEYARETLEIYAPLANRLGIWQIKWELEDLSFRLINPAEYKRIAKLIEEKRLERETLIASMISTIQEELTLANIKAEVYGRPKHIYSIYQKMQGKQLAFEKLYDVRALRVIVDSVKDCYSVLGIIHHLWQPLPKEFDDYISRPKPNGYQSLHTVVTIDSGKNFEVQIRTQAMHQFAEFGVAAHWRYKEAGSAGYGGSVEATSSYDDKIAILRELLAWKNEVVDQVVDASDWVDQLKQAVIDEHIYVLTPQAQIIELPTGSTPLDFAYHVHTNLGHRCRGARVDGAMVTLNTPLKSGQTVEIIVAKGNQSIAPSRDWLNAQAGYLVSQRAKQKVRQWFNAQAHNEDIATGRSIVERELQRLGKTAINLDSLAHSLGFDKAEELFLTAAREDFKTRSIEQAFQTPMVLDGNEPLKLRVGDGVTKNKGDVLVVGVDALLTQLAKCCRPIPPDAIVGYVTRGRGVSIHRQDCTTFARMMSRDADRVIDVTWGKLEAATSLKKNIFYPIDIAIRAQDRQGLLRDISEVFAREKNNVVGVQTLSSKNLAHMIFTVEISHGEQLQRILNQLNEVIGVLEAQRKH